MLQLIDAVEALDIDPADAAPDYWHHVHNRLVGQRSAATLHPLAPPGLASPAGGLRYEAPHDDPSHGARPATVRLLTTYLRGASPRYIWNVPRTAFRSVSIACSPPAG